MKRRLKSVLWVGIAVLAATAPVAAGIIECMQHANQVLAQTEDQGAAQDALTHCCAVEGCTIIWM